MFTTITDPQVLRGNKPLPFGYKFVQDNTFFVSENSGHKFKVGETRTLVGLVDFPEFNGQQVKILNYRQDVNGNKTYYIEGEINQFLDWVYEYRLK